MLKILNKKYIFVVLICLAVFFVFNFTANAAVTISVTPITSSVLPGSVRSVYSNIQGDANVAVAWSASGGSLVSAVGYAVWTAPQTPGTYTVTATSLADSTQSASSTFTVISNAVVKVSNIPMQATIFKNQPLIIQNILWGSVNTSVTWSSSGGILRGTGREVVFSASTPGTYTVTATSQADNSKTTITTIVVTNNLWSGVATANKTQPVDCTPTGSGTTYNVTSLATFDAVPWITLAAGDTVRIHTGVTYNRQILLATSGTAIQPIRICGVRDGSGNLPVLSGINAISTAPAGSYGGAGGSIQGLGGITVYNYGGAYYGGAVYPKHIIIEGLKITGYHMSNNYRDVNDGIYKTYDRFTACIRIQRGGSITLRGNDFSACGLGVFTVTQGITSRHTRDLLIEGNWFHGNAVLGSSLEHATYLQSLGLVVQGNYFDYPLTNSGGSQLKTRSIQQFIRYNYFEPASRILDLVEVQDYPEHAFPWIGIDSGDAANTSASDVVANYEAYQDRFVYGNIIHNLYGPSFTQTSLRIVHGAGDLGQSENPGGNLYFYHNTLRMTTILGETSNWSNIIVDFGPYGDAIGAHTIWPTARITNNAIHIRNNDSGPVFMWNSYSADRVVLDKNWISTTWGTGDPAGGLGTGISNNQPGDGYPWQGGVTHTQVSGTENLVTDATLPFDNTTYTPIPGGPLVGSSTSLPGKAASLPPLMQYSPVTGVMALRPSTQDIGAVAYSVSDTTPPAAPTNVSVI
ncbi:MAG: hypothetical protein WC618_01225 [Patescibacteria group bacterium]